MVTIRAERAADRLAIDAVHRSAFPTDAEARLVDAMRDHGKLSVSLVAEVQGEVVGHIAFSAVSLEPAVPGAIGVGLAPVAVLPAHQRRGVGARLIEAGIEACRRANCGFVVVLGEPGYYRRFGFQRASQFGLGNEYGADEEFMVLELRPGGLPSGDALVRYGPEFGALGT